MKKAKKPTNIEGVSVQIVVQREKDVLDAMKRGPRPKFPRQGGQAVGQRKPCKRQVYTGKLEAENTARMLADKHIAAAEVERCPICGMLHLIELRAT